jgi:hypothetical protein
VGLAWLPAVSVRITMSLSSSDKSTTSTRWTGRRLSARATAAKEALLAAHRAAIGWWVGGGGGAGGGSRSGHSLSMLAPGRVGGVASSLTLLKEEVSWYFFLTRAEYFRTAVLGIRDILMRIRIRGSEPLTNGSGSDSFLQ